MYILKSTFDVNPLLNCLSVYIYIYIMFMGWGSLGSIVGRSRGSCSCYSCFTCKYLECSRGLAITSSLTIPAPVVFLRVGWSITLVPPWVTTSHFLSLHSYFSLFSCLSSSPDPQDSLIIIINHVFYKSSDTQHLTLREIWPKQET